MFYEENVHLCSINGHFYTQFCAVYEFVFSDRFIKIIAVKLITVSQFLYNIGFKLKEMERKEIGRVRLVKETFLVRCSLLLFSNGWIRYHRMNGRCVTFRRRQSGFLRLPTREMHRTAILPPVLHCLLLYCLAFPTYVGLPVNVIYLKRPAKMTRNFFYHSLTFTNVLESILPQTLCMCP